MRTPLCPVLGRRSLLVHPRRQAERVPRLVPGARAWTGASTGQGWQIDHTEEVNRRMLDFTAAAE